MSGYLFHRSISQPIACETVRFSKKLFTCFDFCPEALYAQNKTVPTNTRVAAKGKQRPSNEQTIQRSRQTKYSLRVPGNWGQKTGLRAQVDQQIKDNNTVIFHRYICDSFFLSIVNKFISSLCQKVLQRLLLVLSPFRCACTGTAK